MAYLNVYQSGYYHRLGKPGQYNCHPGDLYPTYEAATQDVDPEARHLYLGTWPVDIPESVLGAVNPPDCVPTPLSKTRRELAKAKVREDWQNIPRVHDAFGVEGFSELGSSDLSPLKDYRVPSHIVGMRPLVKAVEDWPTNGSLETSADEAVHIDPPNVVAYRREQRYYDEPEDLTLGLPSRFGAGEEGR